MRTATDARSGLLPVRCRARRVGKGRGRQRDPCEGRAQLAAPAGTGEQGCVLHSVYACANGSVLLSTVRSSGNSSLRPLGGGRGCARRTVADAQIGAPAGTVSRDRVCV